MAFQSPDANPTIAELPLLSGGNYSFTVNWGDGNTDVITTWTDANKVHTYGDSSSYNVTIVGTIQGFSYEDAGVADANRQHLIKIDEWGDLEIFGTNTYVFGKCNNLTGFASNGPTLSNTNSLVGFFYQCTSLTNITNFPTWDISNVNTFESLFELCSSIETNALDLETKDIVNMSFMFNGCSVFNADITTWNTSGVTTMKSMFKNCAQFNKNIGSWDTSSVTDMTEMFRGAAQFNFSINEWNVSGVTNMDGMFKGATDFDGRVDWGDISSLSGLTEFMPNITYSTSNYDSLLNTWASSPIIQYGVTADFGGIQYTVTGEPGRDTLTGPNGWTINDGGK